MAAQMFHLMQSFAAAAHSGMPMPGFGMPEFDFGNLNPLASGTDDEMPELIPVDNSDPEDDLPIPDIENKLNQAVSKDRKMDQISDEIPKPSTQLKPFDIAGSFSLGTTKISKRKTQDVAEVASPFSALSFNDAIANAPNLEPPMSAFPTISFASIPNPFNSFTSLPVITTKSNVSSKSDESKSFEYPTDI